MRIVNIQVTQSHLEYLSGCRYATLLALAAVLNNEHFKGSRGRPMRHGPLAMAALVLMKMRHHLSCQAIEALAVMRLLDLVHNLDREGTALLPTG